MNELEATTTTCPKCNDRGVIHTDLGFGWGFNQCDCRPPEYWAEQSDKRMAELKQRIREAEKRLKDGEADQRGQEH